MYRKFSGFSYKEKPEPLPSIVIGQLGKNSSIKNNPLSGDTILQYAFNLISIASKIFGGRFILVECEDNEKLKE